MSLVHAVSILSSREHDGSSQRDVLCGASAALSVVSSLLYVLSVANSRTSAREK